jgi:hypothetical protein
MAARLYQTFWQGHSTVMKHRSSFKLQKGRGPGSSGFFVAEQFSCADMQSG